MTGDEIGPMRISDGLMESESSMPEIPIKPNTTIPVTIGILLILGGLLLAFNAYSNFSGPDSADAPRLAETINQGGGEITEQEIVDYFDSLNDEGYYTTLAFIESLAAVALLCGGILLIRRMRLGIKVGIAGGGLVVVDAIMGYLILNRVESPDPFLSMTLDFMAVICFVCGLVCMVLPLIPLVISSGKAALLPVNEWTAEE